MHIRVKLKKRLTEREARGIFQQLSHAIAYLHTLSITHRDIKLENVLFDGQKRVKLADFGFAVYSKDKRLKVLCGTPSYMAAEVVKREAYIGLPVDWLVNGRAALCHALRPLSIHSQFISQSLQENCPRTCHGIAPVSICSRPTAEAHHCQSAEAAHCRTGASSPVGRCGIHVRAESATPRRISSATTRQMTCS